MSYHVFIAHSGFKDTPIGGEEFANAVRQCPELRLEEMFNQNGKPVHRAYLGKGERVRIGLSIYGLGEAPDPSRAMVESMFRIAAILGAGVYSERLKRYASPDDWERSTQRYRDEQAARRRQERLRRLGFIGAVAATSLLLAWLMPLLAGALNSHQILQ
jgi:hypothetical protein